MDAKTQDILLLGNEADDKIKETLNKMQMETSTPTWYIDDERTHWKFTLFPDSVSREEMNEYWQAITGKDFPKEGYSHPLELTIAVNEKEEITKMDEKGPTAWERAETYQCQAMYGWPPLPTHFNNEIHIKENQDTGFKSIQSTRDMDFKQHETYHSEQNWPQKDHPDAKMITDIVKEHNANYCNKEIVDDGKTIHEQTTSNIGKDTYKREDFYEDGEITKSKMETHGPREYSFGVECDKDKTEYCFSTTDWIQDNLKIVLERGENGEIYFTGTYTNSQGREFETDRVLVTEEQFKDGKNIIDFALDNMNGMYVDIKDHIQELKEREIQGAGLVGWQELDLSKEVQNIGNFENIDDRFTKYGEREDQNIEKQIEKEIEEPSR